MTDERVEYHLNEVFVEYKGARQAVSRLDILDALASIDMNGKITVVGERRELKALDYMTLDGKSHVEISARSFLEEGAPQVIIQRHEGLPKRESELLVDL